MASCCLTVHLPGRGPTSAEAHNGAFYGSPTAELLHEPAVLEARHFLCCLSLRLRTCISGPHRRYGLTGATGATREPCTSALWACLCADHILPTYGLWMASGDDTLWDDSPPSSTRWMMPGDNLISRCGVVWRVSDAAPQERAGISCDCCTVLAEHLASAAI